MSYADPMSNPYRAVVAAEAPDDARAGFLTKTYMHLAAAIAAFVVIEGLLLSIPGVEAAAQWAYSGFNWLIVLGAFMAVSWIADKWAHSTTSIGMQYFGLAVYVVAEAVILLPLMVLALLVAGPPAIATAGIITFTVFTGLTGIVLFTGSNFSFLKPFLGVAFIVALGLIVCSILFGFDLGMAFSAAMVLVAAGSVLYSTGQVLKEYPIGFHVGAALTLFAAIGLLFFYVLQIVISLSSD